ncbi:MAG: extracellular solute-binding protein [Candidatus Riflebacteria bacterium]|nr:extracellular solute-binding protein [Candidatus Riflebacteria bacterium]
MNKLFSILLLLLMISAGSSAEQQTVLKFWVMGGEGKLIPQVLQNFEKENPDIKVITQAVSWDSAHEKLVTAIIGGTTPDICQLGTTWMSKFHAMNAFLPMDELIKESDFNTSDFFKDSLETNRFEKKLFGVPWYVDTRVLYYRSDLLSNLGYKTFPSTWDEFENLGRKVLEHKRKNSERGYFYSFPANDITVLMYYWQSGFSLNFESKSCEYFSKPGMIQAIKKVKSFYDQKFNSMTEYGGMQYFDAFSNGFFPVMLSGPWLANDLELQLPHLKGLWNTAKLPKNVKSTSFVGGSNLIIFKNSRNVQAAWKLIKYLTRPSTQISWFEISRDLPSSRSAWSSPELSKYKELSAFKDQLEDSCFPPAVPEWEHIAAKFGGILEECFRGKINETEAADKLSDSITSLFSRAEKNQSLTKKVVISTIIILIPFAAILLYLKGNKGTHKSPWQSYNAFFFLAPAIIMIVFFRLIPIVVSFLTSLTNWDMYGLADLSRVSFIGLENYYQLFSDKVFLQSVRNTALFVLVGVPLNLVLSLSCAIFINQPLGRMKTPIRTIMFIPAVTTAVAAAITWRWLYSYEFGYFNILLQKLNIDRIEWLTNPSLAWLSIILMSVWKGFGYNMIIFLAALQNIPRELNESVEMDGGNWWHKFIHVTIPFLQKTILFVFVATFVGYIHFFTEPLMLTGGGPLNSTTTLMMYTYFHGFKFYNLGYACSIIYSVFFFFIIFNFLQRKLRERIL